MRNAEAILANVKDTSLVVLAGPMLASVVLMFSVTRTQGDDMNQGFGVCKVQVPAEPIQKNGQSATRYDAIYSLQ